MAVKWCMAGETCGDSDGEDMGEVISVPVSVVESSQLLIESPRGLYSRYGVAGYIIFIPAPPPPVVVDGDKDE